MGALAERRQAKARASPECGRVDHCVLLEILTDLGVGTMIRSH